MRSNSYLRGYYQGYLQKQAALTAPVGAAPVKQRPKTQSTLDDEAARQLIMRTHSKKKVRPSKDLVKDPTKVDLQEQAKVNTG
jgi:hypothetical protein